MNANTGMAYPVASTISSYSVGSSITYGTGKKLAEAVSANISWNRNDGHFYGDDVELDTDNSVTGYTISFEPSGLADDIRSYLLGETKSSNEYSVVDTASPDLGFGYIRVMRSKTVGSAGAATTKYESWWYYKLKFAISSEESRTKEATTEWRVPTLDGTGSGVSLDGTGTLKFAVHQTHDSLAAAKSWLNSKANIS